MKFIKIATVIACLLPITDFSQATNPAPEGAKPAVVKKYSFKKIDFNGDKQISKEEEKKAGISEAEFNLNDKDRSDFIT